MTVLSYNRLIRKVKQFLFDVDNWELQEGGIDPSANESRAEVSRELKRKCEQSRKDDTASDSEDY